MSTTQEQERARLAAINEIIKTLGSSLDVRQVYDTFASQLKRLVAFDRAAVAVIDGDKASWFAIASEVETELDRRRVFPLEGSAVQWVAAHKKVYYAPDLAQERQLFSDDVLFKAGIRSIMRIPLFSKGEVIGIFSVNSRQPNAFGEKEREILEEVAPLLSVAVENTRLFEQTRAMVEELRESEGKYRHLFQDLTDAAFLADVETGLILDTNLQGEALLGKSRDEIVGMHQTNLHPPGKADEYRQRFAAHIEKCHAVDYDGEVIRKDGTIVPVRIGASTLTLRGQHVILGLFQDITERKRAEEEIRKLSSAVDQSIDGIALGDVEPKLTYVNDAFARMHGYSPEEMIGMKVANLHNDEQMDDFEKGVKQIKTEGGWEGEIGHISKDGTPFPTYMSVTLLKDENGKALGILAVCSDITERKRAEESLRLYQDIVNNTQIGLSVYHLEDIDDERTLRLVAMNPAVMQITRSTEDRVGTTVAESGVIKTQFPKLLAEVVRSGKARDLGEARYGDQRVAEAVYAVKAFPLPNNHVGVAIENVTERKRVEEKFLRHARREEALHAVAQTVSQTLDLEQMLGRAVETVMAVMEAHAATMYLFDEAAGELVLKAHKGVSEEFVASVGRLRLDKEEIERAVGWKEATITAEELLDQPNLARVRAAVEKEGLQSRTVVPLWSKGIVLGALEVAYRDLREFTPDDLELLQAIGNQIGVGIENARLFAEVSYSATVDGLTGLYNHRYFQERLEEEVARLVRFGGECSLLMLDLDYFKIYNDLFGHVAGDEVLKRLGQVLRDHTRQVDIACRYGGEEFAVILPETGSADAYQVAERLRQAVETALSLEGGTASSPLTISLGVASCPGDGLSREALVRAADLALREAKERGRNQTCSASELGSATPAEVSWDVVEHLEAASLNTIYALAAAVDARDHYTYGHSRNVSKHAVAIGKEFDLSRRRLGRLRICALLHDIGKIGLSDSIIRKPGSLDEKEWEMMRKHSALGATIISHTPELADCAPAIRHHHEWYDGSGYPDGLKGEDIPLEARIIATADAYDTMTTPRAYRETLTPQEALEELERCANTQFDPHLVETFTLVVDVGEPSLR